MKPITVYIPDDYPLPENVERYEFRPAKPGEAYFSGIENRPVTTGWPTVYSFIVAVPKPSFPASVPGFRKGTWFAKNDSGLWFGCGVEPIFRDRAWNGAATFIRPNMFAHDILAAIDVSPEGSKFQTTEDG